MKTNSTYTVIGISTAFETREEDFLLPERDFFYRDRSYFQAIESVGGVPLLVVPLKKAAMEFYFDHIHGLIMTGGGRFLFDPKTGGENYDCFDLERQNPARFAFDSHLIREALGRDLPLMGICRGHQMINYVLGGTLTGKLKEGRVLHQQKGKHPPDRPVHEVKIKKRSKLFEILEEDCIYTNSFHNQAVETFRAPILASGHSEDGVIEVIESNAHSFVMGFQFHPEKMLQAHCSGRILQAFVKAARHYREGKRKT